MTTGVSVVVMTSVDAVQLMRGSLTGAQLMKNTAVTTASTAAGTGAVLLATPLVMAGPVGWAILAVVGTAAGAAGGMAGKAAMDQMIRDDSLKLQEILEAVIGEQAEECLLSQDELNEVLADLPDRIKPHTRAILTAFEPRKYATEAVVLPLLEQVLAKRPKIRLPGAEAFLVAVEEHVTEVVGEMPELDVTSLPNTSATIQRFLTSWRL